jgi:acyl-CoA synthetase (AMP-forming)/AMP-acid ligase II
MLLTQMLERAASEYPRQIAVVCGDARFTYGELAQRVARLASGLLSSGVTAGDRVAILHRNCHRFLEAYFAANWAGAVLVPLNLRLRAADLAYIIDDTESRLLIADDGCSELARQAVELADGECRLLWSGLEGTVGDDYEVLLAGSTPVGAAASDDNEPANIYYTSGTTGHHKGVVLTTRNIASHALSTIAELALADADVWIHVAPMFHLADAWATWAVTWVGGRHVMAPRFEPATVLRLMEANRVTVTNLVPTMLNDLVNHPAASSTDLAGFRLVMSGGAPIAPALVQRVVETFGCEYVQTYGLTETSPYLTFSLLKAHLKRLPEERQMFYRSRTGRAALGVSLRVVGDDGREVAADGQAVGEIVARGDRITPGYWRLPEATAAACVDGWFHTGDLATIDAEGYLNIVDRKKDVMLTGGEMVYSTEVEHAIAAHPGVLEVAVVGVPDERLGEAVHAEVVVRPGQRLDADAIIRFCRDHLARYKCPRTVAFAPALPRTGSGKIAKRLIRDRFLS